MTDIIARGMAANSGEKAKQALDVLSELSNGIRYKGVVENYEALPSDAEQGDVYITEDTGKRYIYGYKDGTLQWTIFSDNTISVEELLDYIGV